MYSTFKFNCGFCHSKIKKSVSGNSLSIFQMILGNVALLWGEVSLAPHAPGLRLNGLISSLPETQPQLPTRL